MKKQRILPRRNSNSQPKRSWASSETVSSQNLGLKSDKRIIHLFQVAQCGASMLHCYLRLPCLPSMLSHHAQFWRSLKLQGERERQREKKEKKKRKEKNPENTVKTLNLWLPISFKNSTLARWTPRKSKTCDCQPSIVMRFRNFRSSLQLERHCQLITQARTRPVGIILHLSPNSQSSSQSAHNSTVCLFASHLRPAKLLSLKVLRHPRNTLRRFFKWVARTPSRVVNNE